MLERNISTQQSTEYSWFSQLVMENQWYIFVLLGQGGVMDKKKMCSLKIFFQTVKLISEKQKIGKLQQITQSINNIRDHFKTS